METTATFETATIFKRKYRYTVQIVDENEQEVFPEAFVKLEQRLPFRCQDQRWIGVGGMLHFTQYFTMFDKKGEARERYDKQVSGLKDGVLHEARLRRYDGCGVLLEEWRMQDLELTPRPDYHSEDCIIADWWLRYQRLQTLQ